MVGRVIVGRLRSRIRGVLVVNWVVCCGTGCRLALLVCVPCRAVRRSPLQRCLSQCSRLVVIIVVDDNNLLGQAVLVEVSPIRMPCSLLAVGAPMSGTEGCVRGGNCWGCLLCVLAVRRISAPGFEAPPA